MTADDELPVVWRIPPWQPALLILVATGLLALDLYAGLSFGARLMTAVIAAACLFGAVVALRFLLVADADGIWVRHIVGQQHVEWRDVADVEVTVSRRNATTIRITRHDKTYVDVPPSLLLPTLPTSMRKVRSIMGTAAAQLLALAHAHQRS